MIYVALSRVQCLYQLFILDSLTIDKIKPWIDAVEEMKRLDQLDKERQKSVVFKLISMNTNSLQAHYQDILADNELLSSTVVCLQETL